MPEKKKKKSSRTDSPPEKGGKKKTSAVSAIENLCGQFRHRKRCQNCHVTDRRTNAINSIDVK
jgi:hypothetical protein